MATVLYDASTGEAVVQFRGNTYFPDGEFDVFDLDLDMVNEDRDGAMYVASDMEILTHLKAGELIEL